MSSFGELDRAIDERAKEWDRAGARKKLSVSFHSNELGGEAGELLAVALKLMIATGNAQNVTKKLEREELGLPGSTATVDALMDELADVVICAAKLARQYKQQLGNAVRRKFNGTSDKVGLKTKMGPGGDPRCMPAAEATELCRQILRENGFVAFEKDRVREVDWNYLVYDEKLAFSSGLRQHLTLSGASAIGQEMLKAGAIAVSERRADGPLFDYSPRPQTILSQRARVVMPKSVSEQNKNDSTTGATSVEEGQGRHGEAAADASS